MLFRSPFFSYLDFLLLRCSQDIHSLKIIGTTRSGRLEQIACNRLARLAKLEPLFYSQNVERNKNFFPAILSFFFLWVLFSYKTLIVQSTLHTLIFKYPHQKTKIFNKYSTQIPRLFYIVVFPFMYRAYFLLVCFAAASFQCNWRKTWVPQNLFHSENHGKVMLLTCFFLGNGYISSTVLLLRLCLTFLRVRKNERSHILPDLFLSFAVNQKGRSLVALQYYNSRPFTWEVPNAHCFQKFFVNHFNGSSFKVSGFYGWSCSRLYFEFSEKMWSWLHFVCATWREYNAHVVPL